MIEILETIEIAGQKCDVAATWKNGLESSFRRILWPYSIDRPDGSFCGHTQCWNELTVRFEASMN